MKDVRFDVQKGEIYSATGTGKIPWISVKEIGAVGYRALTDEVSHNTDHVVLGPELLSYDEVSPPMLLSIKF
jgi:festuclavine dehydrogenase